MWADDLDAGAQLIQPAAADESEQKKKKNLEYSVSPEGKKILEVSVAFLQMWRLKVRHVRTVSESKRV